MGQSKAMASEKILVRLGQRSKTPSQAWQGRLQRTVRRAPHPQCASSQRQAQAEAETRRPGQVSWPSRRGERASACSGVHNGVNGFRIVFWHAKEGARGAASELRHSQYRNNFWQATARLLAGCGTVPELAVHCGGAAGGTARGWPGRDYPLQTGRGREPSACEVEQHARNMGARRNQGVWDRRIRQEKRPGAIVVIPSVSSFLSLGAHRCVHHVKHR